MIEEYGLSVERGFLPAEDPLQRLPSAFAPWESVADDLTKLLLTGRVRHFLSSLPLLDTTELRDQRELERAMLLCSYFGHAWVWGEKDVVHSLPPQIAVPWRAVAMRLGRPPVLSYASHALSNWRRLDTTRPVALGNVVRLMNFYGGMDEEWFVLIHIAIESKAGPALRAGVDLQQAVRSGDVAAATTALRTLADTTQQLVDTLSKMPENCDPYIYFTRVRPFIFGWHSNPALPGGLLYEGIAEWNGERQQFRGETGAQSSIIPTLDAALGLKFDMGDAFGRHLMELRSYMPPRHRAFIEALEQSEAQHPARDFVVSRASAAPALVSAYNRALELVYEFRALHLKLAGSYIAKQQSAAAGNPTQTGTGGTPFMAYLHSHAVSTLAHRV